MCLYILIYIYIWFKHSKETALLKCRNSLGKWPIELLRLIKLIRFRKLIGHTKLL